MTTSLRQVVDFDSAHQWLRVHLGLAKEPTADEVRSQEEALLKEALKKLRRNEKRAHTLASQAKIRALRARKADNIFSFLENEEPSRFFIFKQERYVPKKAGSTTGPHYARRQRTVFKNELRKIDREILKPKGRKVPLKKQGCSQQPTIITSKTFLEVIMDLRKEIHYEKQEAKRLQFFKNYYTNIVRAASLEQPAAPLQSQAAGEEEAPKVDPPRMPDCGPKQYAENTVRNLLDFTVSNISLTEFESLLEQLKPTLTGRLLFDLWYASDHEERFAILVCLMEAHNLLWTLDLKSVGESLLSMACGAFDSIKDFFTPKNQKEEKTVGEEPPSSTEELHSQGFVKTDKKPAEWITKATSFFGISPESIQTASPFAVSCIAVLGVILTFCAGSVVKLSDGFIKTATTALEGVATLSSKMDTLISKFSKLWQWLMETVASWFGMEYMSDDDAEQKTIKDKITETCKEIETIYETLQVNPAFLLADPRTISRIEKTLSSMDDALSKLLHQKKNVYNIKPYLDNTKNKFEKVREAYHNILASAMCKQLPVTIWLAGESGVGKSHLVPEIIEALSEYEGRHLTCYTRAKDDKYCSVYDGQDVFFYDDFGAAVESNDGVELDQIYTNATYHLNMADIPSKGTVFASRYVIICSNQEYPNESCLKDTTILDRRRDFTLRVECPGIEKYRNQLVEQYPPGFWKKRGQTHKLTLIPKFRGDAARPGVIMDFEDLVQKAYNLQCQRRDVWFKHINEKVKQFDLLQTKKIVSTVQAAISPAFVEEDQEIVDKGVTEKLSDSSDSELDTDEIDALFDQAKKPPKPVVPTNIYTDCNLAYKKVFLLTGSPGTGKTTAVQMFHAHMSQEYGWKTKTITASCTSQLEAVRKGEHLDSLLIDDWLQSPKFFEEIWMFVFDYALGNIPHIDRVFMTCNFGNFITMCDNCGKAQDQQAAFMRRCIRYDFRYRSRASGILTSLFRKDNYSDKDLVNGVKEGRAYDDFVLVLDVTNPNDIISYTSCALQEAWRQHEPEAVAVRKQTALPVMGVPNNPTIILNINKPAYDFLTVIKGSAKFDIVKQIPYIRIEKGFISQVMDILSTFTKANAEKAGRVQEKPDADSYLLDMSNRQCHYPQKICVDCKFKDQRYCFLSNERNIITVFKVCPEVAITSKDLDTIIVTTANQQYEQKVQRQLAQLYSVQNYIDHSRDVWEEEKKAIQASSTILDICNGFWYLIRTNFGTIIKVVGFLLKVFVSFKALTCSYDRAHLHHLLRKYVSHRMVNQLNMEFESTQVRKTAYGLEHRLDPEYLRQKIALELEASEDPTIGQHHGKAAPVQHHKNIVAKHVATTSSSWADQVEWVFEKNKEETPEEIEAESKKSAKAKELLKQPKQKIKTSSNFKGSDPTFQTNIRTKPDYATIEIKNKEFDGLDWASIVPEEEFSSESSARNPLHPKFRVPGKFNYGNKSYVSIHSAYRHQVGKIQDEDQKLKRLTSIVSEVYKKCDEFKTAILKLTSPPAIGCPDKFFEKHYNQILIDMLKNNESEVLGSEAISDPTAVQVMDLVKRNIVSVVGPVGHITNAIIIKDHIGVTNEHAREYDEQGKPRTYIHVQEPGSNEIHKCKILDADDKHDWLIFETPAKMRSYRSVLQHIPSKSEYPDISYSHALIITPRRGCDENCFILNKIRLETLRERAVDKVIRYGIYYAGAVSSFSVGSPIMTQRGDCGSPVVVFNTSISHKFIGFHNAGGETHGLGTILYQELFEKYLPLKTQSGDIKVLKHQEIAKDDAVETYHGFPVFGKTKFNQYQPVTTTLWRSPLACPDIIPDTHEPSVLDRHDPRLPSNYHGSLYVEAISKWNHEQPEVDDNELAIVAEEVADYYAFKAKGAQSYVRKLTKKEALNRCTRMEKSNPIFRHSSAGYPWKHKVPKGSKMPFLESIGEGSSLIWTINKKVDCGQQLNNAVDQLIECARNQERTAVVFAGNLKDEAVKKSKVREEPKTRSFAGAPLDYTIAMRMYFQGAYCAITSLYNECPAKVGIDPNSLDWHNLYYYLVKVSDHGFDADYKNWDAHVPRKFMEAIPTVYNRIYQVCDPEWKAEDDIIRNTLHSHLHGPLITFNNWVVKCPGGQVSGQPGTTIDNCIVNVMYFYYAWRQLMRQAGRQDLVPFSNFLRLTSLAVYGDDNVCAIDPSVSHIFNLEAFAGFMKENLNLTVTCAAKTGELYQVKPIKDCEFLKRTFRQYKNRILGSLVMESFSKMISWTTARRHIYHQDEDVVAYDDNILIQAADSLLNEAWNYGPKFYRGCLAHVQKVFGDLDINVHLISFNEIAERRGFLVP